MEKFNPLAWYEKTTAAIMKDEGVDYLSAFYRIRHYFDHYAKKTGLTEAQAKAARAYDKAP